MTNASHEFLFHTPRALITARCTRCHRPAGTFWAEDPCAYHPGRDRGIWTPGTCTCTPAPQLPVGDELAALCDRARSDAHPCDPHAAVKIHVR
jgi:hypothetical protein